MHELGLTRNIVAIVSERAGAARVKRVSLEIGKLSAVLPDAIRFCFDVCCKDTVLEGAQLEIREIDGRGRCGECGRAIEPLGFIRRCPCGSTRVECLAGEELKIKEMEVF